MTDQEKQDVFAEMEEDDHIQCFELDMINTEHDTTRQALRVQDFVKARAWRLSILTATLFMQVVLKRTEGEYMKKEWCKKLVCGCTHNWQDIGDNDKHKKNTCTVGVERCDECGFYPWIFRHPIYYFMYRKVRGVI